VRDELSGAKKELQKYPGDEVSVADAVSIIGRATSLRVHLLREDEISPALDRAKQLITAGKVREGRYEVKDKDACWNTLGGESGRGPNSHNLGPRTRQGKDSISN